MASRATRSRKTRREETLLQRAIGGFRPRKSDAGKWVFISAYPRKRGGKVVERAGKRLDRNDRRKAFAVYVAKSPKAKTKVRPFREYQRREYVDEQGEIKTRKIKRREKVPTPRSQRSTNLLEDKKNQKAAKDFYYAAVPKKKVEDKATGEIKEERRAAKQDEITPGRGNRNIPLETISDKLASELKQQADFLSSRRSILLDVMALAVDPESGQEVSFEFTQLFRQADLQKNMPVEFYRPFIEKQLWAEMAQQLTGLGMVSRGSARYIRDLAINKGKARKDWRKKDGRPWEKAGMQVVDVKRVDWQMMEQRMTTRGGNGRKGEVKATNGHKRIKATNGGSKIHK